MRQAESDQPESPRHDQPLHLARVRAQREPDADLAQPLGDAEGDEAEEADGAQGDGQDREQAPVPQRADQGHLLTRPDGGRAHPPKG